MKYEIPLKAYARLAAMFEAFSLGPFLIWTRLVFLLVGIWLSTEFFLRLAQSANLSSLHFREHAWRYLIAFLAAGRVVAVMANYRLYFQDPLRLFVVWDGGFSYLGAAIGIGIVLYYATREHRTTFLQWLDVLVPASTFGLTFDWLGRFFAGQAYGKPTDLPWGVTYDALNVRYVVPIHPVQLYYAFFFLLLTFLLLIIRKHSVRAGSETLFGIVVACVATMVFEYFRGDFSVISANVSEVDLLVLSALFLNLVIFLLVEQRLHRKLFLLYVGATVLFVTGYILLRFLWWRPPTFGLRSAQFFAIEALLATVAYVVIHRWRYPNL